MALIKLKYVNAFANRDRKNPRLRYYFRRRGSKAIPLPGLPGSEEFMAAYAAALASLPEHSVEIGVEPNFAGHHQRARRQLLLFRRVAKTRV